MHGSAHPEHSGHTHDHGHAHDHSALSAKRLKVVLVLVLVFAAVEVAGAILSGSLALLSDAGHMLADSLAVFLSLVAFWVSSKRRSSRSSFGLFRAEILAAFINGLLLFFYAGYIIVESIHRIQTPREIGIGIMTWVGAAGLLVNIISALIMHPVSGENLNARGAYLHILSDLLGSVAVLAAAAGIYLTGMTWLDPALSMLIAGLIIHAAVKLIRDSGGILMENAPDHIRPETVRQVLLDLPGVVDVHDLHIWSITPAYPMLSAHLILNNDSPDHSASVLRSAQECLTDRFRIEHSTLQLEYADQTIECSNCEELH